MKKLFSVMLVVLALCGIASAVDIYITDATGASDITIAESDIIELLIYYTGEDIISFDLEADVTGPGTILSGAITAIGRTTDYDGIAMPGGVYGYDIEVTGSADSGRLEPGLDKPLATLLFHCDGEGLVTIDMYDVSTFDTSWGQIFPTYHGMTIHQIPEPATIALLCLGGLLLRKKR